VLSLITICLSTVSCSLFRANSTAENNYEEFKANFPEAAVNLVKDSIKIIFPNNLLFDAGSANLKSSFYQKLDRFAEIINTNTKTNLLITGHTDNSGDRTANVKLSLDRAESVKMYLFKQKVSIKRLFTWGLGEKSPLAPNTSEKAKKQNRRVEFVVLYNPKRI
jgi:outer membrane protein OmpA-like peptidoglycan-associated protein